jgi:hypothetical protein
MKRTGYFFLSFCILITLSYSYSFSQKFILEIKPGLNFLNLSTFKTNGTTQNTKDLRYSFSENNTLLKRRFEPEIFFDIYKLNSKWNLGFGLSVYNWTSFLNASAIGQPNFYYPDSNFKFTEFITKTHSNRSAQFVIHATRTFKINSSIDNKFINRLTFGLGVNRLSDFNLSSELIIYNSLLKNNSGYIKKIEGLNSWNKNRPFVLIKYEVSLFTKKNNLGILNLFINYNQGLTKNNLFSIQSNSNDGFSTLFVSNISRGSGFRIGLSKTFSFKKSK